MGRESAASREWEETEKNEPTPNFRAAKRSLETEKLREKNPVLARGH